MREFRMAATLILMVIFSTASGLAHDDTRTHTSCKYCNMNREVFGHSRMLIEYTDGTSAGLCSIHCSAIELTENMTKVPCRIFVGDYNSRKLIDAMTAHWVVGGSKSGVMTHRAKWAFEKKASAEEFIKKHGGEYASFYDSLRAAFDDLYADVKATLERVEMRRSKGWDMCN